MWAGRSLAVRSKRIANESCYTQSTLKIYLDSCVLNRPFDDQRQDRVRLETEAIVLILSRLERKDWTWVGSQALEVEIEKAPNFEQKSRLKKIIAQINRSIKVGAEELERATIEKFGFIGFDSVHFACAESIGADVFLTTDDRLVKLAKRQAAQLHVRVENPLEWIKEIL